VDGEEAEFEDEDVACGRGCWMWRMLLMWRLLADTSRIRNVILP